MRIISSTFLLCLFAFSGWTQSVVNTSGSTLIDSEYSLSFSLGNVDATFLTASTSILNGGVLQLESKIALTTQQSNDDAVAIYPTITKDVLYVENLRKGDIIIIVDLLGNEKLKANKEVVSLTSLLEGTYLVYVKRDKNLIYSSRIFKS